MYRLYLLFLVLFFSYSSCKEKTKSSSLKKEISFTSPAIITASNPVVTLLDTCAKPLVMIIPTKGSINYTIPTNNGPKTITLSAPVIYPLYGAEAEGYNFMQNFNTEQKLVLSSVTYGYKDKTGNLWFGTSGGGLSKYDGRSFTNFTTSQGLANNLVHCILQDKMGDMWFGTNAGLSKYDGKYFTNYTTSQGLANNIVLTIIEDKMGNLWFGSNGGVSKYGSDKKNKKIGKTFTNYTTEQGLLSNTVLSSIEDDNGNLWFGTDKGISKFNPIINEEIADKCFTNYTIAQGLCNNFVKSICKDKMGNLWFGTLGGGVSKCNPNNKEGPGEKFFTNYTTTEGLLNNNIASIIEDRSGNLWFGTREGLSKYRPNLNDGETVNQFVNYTVVNGLPNKLVSSITEDKSGSLWIANSEGGGLSKYDGKSFTSFTSAQGLVHKKVWNIIEDKSGNLWFATSGGISKYETQKSSNTGFSGCTGNFTNFTLDYIMSNVRCVMEDKRGNIWFGNGYGVTRYDGKSLTNYSMEQGLLNKTVLCIIEDKIGNLWFGTYGGGVSKFDGNLVDAIESGESIPLKNQQGLKKIKGKFVKSFTTYTTAQGLADNTVKCILEDKTGNLWFGTYNGGISKFDGNRVEAIEKGEPFSQEEEQGIKKFDGKSIKSFTNYSREQGLSSNTIYSILEDKKGILWFGTAGGGVCRLNPEHSITEGRGLFTTYTSVQGLANDVVYAIAEDTLNNKIWFGTNLGLSALQLNSISSGQEGAIFENFNNNTGYLIKDVNTGAVFLDKKGILWAGTSDKLVRFDYSSIHKNVELPPVFIQAVKIHGGDIVWNSLKAKKSNKKEMNRTDSLSILNEEIITYGHHFTEIQHTEMRRKFNAIQFDSIIRFYPLPVNLVLPFEHNNITFDFVAIETARPFMVTYQYMLEGYDKEWSLITDKTTATFGNIHEGSYTFKLRAKSPDGAWSEPIMYMFEVLPPWYRTWWMYVSYAFLGLSMIALFFRWRTASLRKEKEILEHTVIERTAEIVEQKELIEEKQKEIVDSINYAKRIQYTLLANDALLQQNLKEYFVLFQPKDIVSGDFYWATLNKGAGDKGQGAGEPHSSNTGPSSLDTDRPSSRFYLAICDSTGHGVPGAFMSLLNTSFLNEAITEKNIKQPNEILNYVRQRLIESISQDGAQDGMDGILLCFENGKITYAAANNAPVIVRDNAVIDLPSDKMPIGKGEKDNSFTLHTIDTKKGDLLYFYTDGYADQFGGPKGKKFKYKQLENLLVSIHQLPVEEQKQMLSSTIENWKGDLEQVDDILIIGMRV
ncbi:MAG: two-component regulator propeller domain-containing protein [Bacteroidota bacterium]